MPYQISRLISSRGELRKRTYDFPGDALRIGRGSSSDVHLDDLGVSFNHAVITYNSDGYYVIRDLTQSATVYVNGRPCIEAVLRDGDRIRIGRYVLTVSSLRESESLVLTVEEQAREANEELAGILPKLQLAGGKWTKTRVSVVLILAILGWTVSAIGMRNFQVFTPGPVSTKHAKFSNQCATCHETFKAVWEAVPDKTCQTCHTQELLSPSHFGNRSLAAHPYCASCHLEHKGKSGLAAVPDVQCVRCHGQLQARDPVLPINTAIHSFTDDHPEFAISQKVSDSVVPKRIRFDDKTMLRDNGKLKLNHAVHLDPDLPTAAGRETLTCVSCHRTDKEGRYMEPVTYQRDCLRCHALEFDPLLPGRSVTHGRQPHEVRRELEEIYANLYRRPLPEEEKKTPGTRRLPVRSSNTQTVYPEERIANAMRLLFAPKGTKCLKCHSVELNEKQKNVEVNSGGTSSNDNTLHTNINQEGALANIPQILKVNVPQRWLPYSRFDHAPHYALPEMKLKRNVCIACHEGVSLSRRTEDVLLPSISLCRSCHKESGGAQSECRTCHDYHQNGIVNEPNHLNSRTNYN